MCAGGKAVLRPTATDRYGRIVAGVECRGEDANAEQVRTGMAWAYTRYQTDSQFELHARASRSGLWVAVGTAAEPVAPLEWRETKRGDRDPITGPCRVGSFVAPNGNFGPLRDGGPTALREKCAAAA